MKQGKQQDKKKGESNFDLAYPVIILTVICIIVSGLLAFTNSATAPKIEAAIKKAAEETRLELLPEASEFTE
ncbi:MAG: hypothetical protein RRY38_02350, partial [Oscillospiraceae bacterium]